LRGLGWLNTGGGELSLDELRGRWVLLDFWTSGCVNCIHVLDELTDLEAEFGDGLAVIGIHSPKFEHEARLDSVMRSVERYGIRHPVLNDAELETWDAYTAGAWPTLVLVDPQGYVVGHWSGEGHRDDVATLISELSLDGSAVQLPASAFAGTRSDHEGPGSGTVDRLSALHYPSKALWLSPAAGREGPAALVADAGNHSVVELAGDLQTIVWRIGSGRRGRLDGPAAEASFDEPGAGCLLPREIARRVGYDLVVADTGNHLLRAVNLGQGVVSTLAGTGTPWRPGDGVSALSSPMGLAWWCDRLWIAMAGIHQLWTFDPVSEELAVAAGTGHEGLVDGPETEAWFAQPSGLAPDGDRLWIVDAESSSLRWLDAQGVHTAIGSGLFDFGHRDGPAPQARLQHPADVAVLPDGTVAIADTYNEAVRRFDPKTRQVDTLTTSVAEVSGLLPAGAGLFAVASGVHRVIPVPLDRAAVVDDGAEHGAHDTEESSAARPAVRLRPGEVELSVDFRPPDGQKLDERYGPSSQLSIVASPPQLLRQGDGTQAGLRRSLTLDGNVGNGFLSVAARAVSCDADGARGAACHLHRQDWLVEVDVAADGGNRLLLELSS
jgi:thiol-disulfide isomerase/thioredoxin